MRPKVNTIKLTRSVPINTRYNIPRGYIIHTSTEQPAYIHLSRVLKNQKLPAGSPQPPLFDSILPAHYVLVLVLVGFITNMEIWKLLKIWNREKETGQVWFKRRKPDLAPKQFPKPVCAITLYTIYSINVVLTYTSEWNYIYMYGDQNSRKYFVYIWCNLERETNGHFTNQKRRKDRHEEMEWKG